MIKSKSTWSGWSDPIKVDTPWMTTPMIVDEMMTHTSGWRPVEPTIKHVEKLAKYVWGVTQWVTVKKFIKVRLYSQRSVIIAWYLITLGDIAGKWRKRMCGGCERRITRQLRQAPTETKWLSAALSSGNDGGIIADNEAIIYCTNRMRPSWWYPSSDNRISVLCKRGSFNKHLVKLIKT